MLRSKTTALLATLGFAGSLGLAHATDIDVRSLVDRDMDGDGSLTMEEYSADDTNDFARFDTDGDGTISPAEFSAGMFTTGDTDRDGTLNAEEIEFLDTVRGSGSISK